MLFNKSSIADINFKILNDNRNKRHVALLTNITTDEYKNLDQIEKHRICSTYTLFCKFANNHWLCLNKWNNIGGNRRREPGKSVWASALDE